MERKKEERCRDPRGRVPSTEVTSMKRSTKSKKGIFYFSVEERQHWSAVGQPHDRIEDVKGCARASNIEKEASLASSQAKILQQGESRNNKGGFSSKRNGLLRSW